VAERRGYIYRRQGATEPELRSLIEAADQGWAWTPARKDTRVGGRGDLLAGDEGRARRTSMEVRWRRSGDGYDVLILALAEQHLEGFEPLSAGDRPWQVAEAACLLQPPFDDARPHRASAFLAPDGSTQFVALIGSADARGGV
jgi:hypothetical protein